MIFLRLTLGLSNFIWLCLSVNLSIRILMYKAYMSVFVQYISVSSLNVDVYQWMLGLSVCWYGYIIYLCLIPCLLCARSKDLRIGGLVASRVSKHRRARVITPSNTRLFSWKFQDIFKMHCSTFSLIWYVFKYALFVVKRKKTTKSPFKGI